ncbi:hypothetical protein [Methanonatronarchaeum sp. AMET-Sl]|uniref:hypothetical protein n=1 Tax=Methanonatronarchaeum sp. AMET-Sl TaxID=3037654 RepID=UPI00244D9CAD|nr:hypothetical protein [Methanonatronarchaeum sp. AMET-Sl]WGI17104.1 hypothetical protein QEN48_06280 [Methanonatronarchaeum sp. AMET-Sl]
MVDFDKLRDIQKEENRTEELLKLNKNFYKNVGEYLKDLEEEIERQDGKAKLILRDEFDSSIQVMENIFHRRIGKIIALSTRHLQNENPNTDKMLPIEKKIYKSLCNDLKTAKNKVLTKINPKKQSTNKKQTENNGQKTKNKPEKQNKTTQKTNQQEKTTKKPEKTFNNSQHSYTVVRILDNFPRFVSSDHRTHHLSKEDIVCIPNNDAEVLMERKIAKKIKIR